ncbi:transporter substrate-binding domain-containing protein [Variovorax rhizosphaerae]|uniref:Transporter substrate-binding domain-containing protein n=1 Tax=Variovorax rhizosphaerae TaxID=1836200 RepID=A0ABU8WJJ0_9BURK
MPRLLDPTIGRAWRASIPMAIAAAWLASSSLVHAETVLEKIKRQGQMSVGYRDDAAPFSSTDSQKKAVGYAVDHCEAVVARIRQDVPNLRVNVRAVDIDRIVSFVKDGVVDLFCSNVSDTPERRTLVSFSKPIFFDGVSVAVRKKDGIAGVDQLNGKSVVVIKTATTADALDAYKQKKSLSWKVETALNPDAALSQLQLGWVQGYARDTVPLAVQMAGVADADQYTVLPERLSSEAIAIVLRKDDTELQALVNGVITDAATSGKAKSWYDKWFMQPIAMEGKSRTLGIPMSAELKAALEAK